MSNEHIEHTEYAGFVKDAKTGEYKILFITEISSVLARNRAIETAKNINQHTHFPYDISDVLVKQRPVKVNYGEWRSMIRR